MITRSVCFICAVLCFAAAVWAQRSPEGHWDGTFSVDSREIGLSLDLAKNARSEWIGSMGIPSEKMTGLVVMNISMDGNSVSFVAVELQMAKFNLTMESDGVMKGTLSTPQGPVPVALKRTGPAKVELIPASPAVSRELEGDWEGSLQTPGRTFKIIVHFRNQPDQTVAATINTPDSGPMDLPLNDVKQAGQKVQFGVKIAHASFEGTLNSEGTELVGEFGHEQNRMPLTLRKK